MSFRLPLVLALLLALPGCAAGPIAGHDPTIGRAADRNGELSNDARTLRLALEQYAVDHDGRYPRDAAEVMREVVTPAVPAYYMPGDRMPPDPWGAEGARVALVDAQAFPLASAFEGVAGPMPADPLAAPGLPEAARRPGTLLYRFVPGDGYYLLAVGEAGGRAVVVDACASAADPRPAALIGARR